MSSARTLSVLVLTLIILGITMVCLSGWTEGQTIIPVVSAQFDYSSKTADVEPGNPSGGIVTNSGTIHCDCGSQPRVDVELSVSAGGWPAAISPESMTFYWGGEDEQSFDVTVAAPEGMSHKVSQSVVVEGEWRGSLGLMGDVDSSSFIIFIGQYFDIILESDEPEDVEPGKSGNITLKIWNQGNGEDSFIIEVDNLNELANKGWRISTVSSQTVEEKGVRHIRIDVTAPSTEDTYHFELTVTSERSQLSNPDDPCSASLDVFVDVGKRGSGSGGGDGGDDDDDDDGLPFISSIEVVGAIGIAMMGAYRRRMS